MQRIESPCRPPFSRYSSVEVALVNASLDLAVRFQRRIRSLLGASRISGRLPVSRETSEVRHVGRKQGGMGDSGQRSI